MTVPKTVGPAASPVDGRAVPSFDVADIDTDTGTGIGDHVDSRGAVVRDAPHAAGAGVLNGPETEHPGDPADDVTRIDPVDAPSLTRRGRIRKWDRPPPPRDWRWAVSHVGRILITIGLLMFGFVGYQLWGTGIETARAQNALENDFEDLLAGAAPVGGDDFVEVEAPTVDQPATTLDTDTDTGTETDTDTETDTGNETGNQPVEAPEPDPVDPGDGAESVDDTTDDVVPVDQQNIPELENGDALARLEIPRIGVNDIVVAGVDKSDLKRGPGHFPDTPLPGQLGNSAIAGHRTTYGQPFHDVDKLEPGDEIRVTTLSGVYVYRVTGQQIVSPSDYQVIATTDPTVANLTLTSCHPKWTAQQRIIIFSELDRTESAPVGEPVYNYGRDIETVDDIAAADDVDELPGDGTDGDETSDTASSDDETSDPGDEAATGDDDVSGSLADSGGGDDGADSGRSATTQNSAGIADAFSDGWFSDPGANPQVGLWGALLAAIGIGAYLLSRRLRRDWVGGLLGIMPFVVALYFFFQNVNRLLPPNL